MIRGDWDTTVAAMIALGIWGIFCLLLFFAAGRLTFHVTIDDQPVTVFVRAH